jgi:hypothetical protein
MPGDLVQEWHPMRETRTDYRPMNLGCSALLLAVVFTVATAVLDWAGAPRPLFAIAFLAVFGFLFVALRSWGRLFTKRYWCPLCKERIRTPTIPRPQPGDPLHFYCPRCDVQWDTGLSTPTWV